MTRPTGVFVDAATGDTVVRELTDEELEIHSATVQENQKETPTDEAPASDDAGAPSTDAG